MVFEHIEKLQQQYTDKYVVVDETRPELLRFRGMTGTVRTVNMSGRALVEFDHDPNTGWFDIDIDFLKVVDAPVAEEAPAAKAAPAKAKKTPAAAPEKPASALETARSSKPAEMSMEEMLAAARGNKPGQGESAGGESKPAEKKPAPAASGSSVDDILAAARGNAGAAAEAPAESPAKAEGGVPTGKAAQAMSMEEMMAAARANTSAGGGGAAPASKAAPEQAATPEPAAEPEPAAAPEPEPEPEPAAAVEAPAAAVEAPAAGGGGLTPEQARELDVDAAVEYCRKTDG